MDFSVFVCYLIIGIRDMGRRSPSLLLIMGSSGWGYIECRCRWWKEINGPSPYTRNCECQPWVDKICTGANIYLFSSGFVLEGTERKANWADGQWEDIYAMGVLETEWAERYVNKTGTE